MHSNKLVYLDSDSIISSLISSQGAAFSLLNNATSDLSFFISDQSVMELKNVVKRLDLEAEKLEEIFKKVTIIQLKSLEYQDYVLDQGDNHIISGAVQSKARFLISYNHKHYKVDKIKADLDIIILTPAQFLQYLRSQ